MMVRGIRFLWLLPSVMLISSCFTGIESTPKITAENVGSEKVVTTEEELFFKDVASEPFGEWREGKVFIVTDDKISLIFGASASETSPVVGSVITYKGCREIPAVTGGVSSELLFTDGSNSEWVYRLNASKEELVQRGRVSVPFTIEQTIVDDVASRLRNRRLYVRTSVWYDTEDHLTYGRRFVPVDIIAVLPGNSVYPVKLVFMDVTAKNGINYHLFMSVADSESSARSFSSLFTFEDPRKQYPEISDANWECIINGSVALDMTRDECRLALGAPNDVVRRPGYDKVHEIWSYDDGVYLMFEDGLLRNFRK